MDAVFRSRPVRLAVAGAAAGLAVAALGYAVIAYLERSWKSSTGWVD